MKKNLLLAAVVLPLMSVSAQWTQVGGTVKVEPNTLKYVTGAYKLAPSAPGTDLKTINKGDIKVDGAFNAGIDPVAGGNGFHNIWTERNDYGQLIIKQDQTVTGKIESQFNLPANMDWLPIAFPFEEFTAKMAADQSDIPAADQVFTGYVDPGAGNDHFDPNRWKNTIFTWNNVPSSGNEKLFYSITRSQGDNLEPELFHEINGINTAVTGDKGYIGKPWNGQKNVTIYPYSITNSGDVNAVGELYSSYIQDAKLDVPGNGTTGNDWFEFFPYGGDLPGVADGIAAGDFGSNIAALGNPYTSTINLDGKLQGITHVWIIRQNGFQRNYGTRAADSNVKVATLDPSSGFATGSADVLLISPHGTFYVRGEQNMPASGVQINFDDNMKTFTKKDDTDVFFTDSSRGYNNDNGFYQATLALYNDEGIYANNEIYIFASNVIQPNTVSRYEAYHNNLGELGLYSLQENADGTVDQSLMGEKVLINGVNATDYLAKPINLVFMGDGEFTIKSELTQNLIDSNNKFYFEDRLTGEIFEVTPDFEYTFTSTGTVDDRFFMYWNGTPDVMAVDNVDLAAQTRVYKFNDDFKVRFANTWTKADIFVYNVLGQLVHTAKQVDASQDYLIPLKGQAAAYIVKAVSESGEVATQKIVKK